MNVAGIVLLRYIGSLPTSAAAQAAYAIGYTELFSLITWTSVGLMGAAAAVAGQNLGAGQPERAEAGVAVAFLNKRSPLPAGQAECPERADTPELPLTGKNPFSTPDGPVGSQARAVPGDAQHLRAMSMAQGRARCGADHQRIDADGRDGRVGFRIL